MTTSLYLQHTRVPGIGALRGLAHLSKTSMFLTAIAGAFVAGLDAGLLHNTWPKYSGDWIPSDVLERKPTWRNFTENPSTVQFIHRNLVYRSGKSSFDTQHLLLISCF